jgi:hypothetical protein
MYNLIVLYLSVPSVTEKKLFSEICLIFSQKMSNAAFQNSVHFHSWTGRMPLLGSIISIFGEEVDVS